jgi:hypothetical protein
VTVDFTQYNPPGVYVRGNAEGIVTPVGVPTTTVTVVGQARGYQVSTESVTLTTTAKPLLNKGVLPDSDTSPDLVVTKADGTVLVENTDYALVRGATASESTTIARVGASTAVTEGEVVTVSYSYADETYYSPQRFDEYYSVEQIYGPAMLSSLPSDPDGSQVASPVSLAARIAFENGAGTVVCLAVEPTTTEINLRTRFQQAYTKLQESYSTTLLVPVFAAPDTDGTAYTSGFAGLVSDARTHCETQAASGFGRIAFVGADTLYDDSGTSFDEVAAAVGSKRVMLAFPNRMHLYNNNLGQTTEVGGQYLAAAYAGRLAASDLNRGLTQQQIYGFSGIPTTVKSEMTRTFKNTLSAAGVAVTEVGRSNRLVVRHGISTDPTSLLTREISVTRSQDTLYQLVSEGIIAADLIGDPIDDEMTIRVKGILTGILDAAETDLVLREWLDLQVRQQSLPSGDPTAIEAQFTYRPFLPLNYITVSFSMDLSTSEILIEEQDAAA